MKKLLMLLLLPVMASAANVAEVVEAPGVSISVYEGAGVIKQIAVPAQPINADCINAAIEAAIKRKPGKYSYGCQDARDKLTITVKAETPIPPPVITWTKFLDEGWPNPPKKFSVNKLVQIRYGHPPSNVWSYKTMVAGTIGECGNAFFGPPADTLAEPKQCDTSDLSAVSVITPPVPVPDEPAVCEKQVTTSTTACANGKQSVTTTTSWIQIKPPVGNGAQCPATTVVVTEVNCGGMAKPIPAPASTFKLTGLLLQPASFPPRNPSGDGVGAFRNPCKYSHMGFNDPILYPGAPDVSHLHEFFGNKSTDAMTTTASLLAQDGSSCAGGTANLSAYWVPAMVDMLTMKAFGADENLIYYKSGYNSIPRNSLLAPPNGLRWVTGNKPTNTGLVDSPHHGFECWDKNGQRYGRVQYIPDCPVGGYIEVLLDFQNCWDKTNLASIGGRDHMAYSGGGNCPASHPQGIATVSLNLKYYVRPGQNTRNWRLASDNYPMTNPDGSIWRGGYSMHGDVWIAWNDEVKNSWNEDCVKAGYDCHAYHIGRYSGQEMMTVGF